MRWFISDPDGDADFEAALNFADGVSDGALALKTEALDTGLLSYSV